MSSQRVSESAPLNTLWSDSERRGTASDFQDSLRKFPLSISRTTWLTLTFVLAIAFLMGINAVAQLRYIGGNHWEVMKDPFTQIIAKQEGRWPAGMYRSRPGSNPESTRILVPMVVYGLKHLGITQPRTLVFLVEALSGLLIAVGFLFLVRKFTPDRRIQFLSLCFLALFVITAQKDILLLRLGDNWGIGLLLPGLVLSYHIVKKPGWLWVWSLPLLAFVISLHRVDYAMLIAFAVWINSVVARDKKSFFLSFYLLLFALATYWGVLKVLNLHNLYCYTVMVGGCKHYRVVQVFTGTPWFFTLAFLNVLLALAFVLPFKKVVSADYGLFFAFLIYSLCMPFIGGFIEYRIWLPLVVMVTLFFARYLDQTKALETSSKVELIE